MHKTLMLKGSFKDKKSKIKIQGGLVPDVVTEGSSFSVAIEQIPHLLGRRAVEIRKTLCFPEFRNKNIASLLDSWIREGKIFFTWRCSNKHVSFLVLDIPADFEVDDVLEELLNLTINVPTLGSCTGEREGLVSYNLKRVTKNALEVVVRHDNHPILHVGYASSGSSLSEAILGVSKIVKSTV